jgi:HEPN domain-containing protein
MKSRADLVRGWLRKAGSDLENVRLCLAAGQALDTACFHAQQAVEKSLKAYLVAYEVDFPYLHNLEKLVAICAQRDSAFLTLLESAQELTPYAVELRYDEEFWPDPDTAQAALRVAEEIQAFVVARLPAECRPI